MRMIFLIFSGLITVNSAGVSEAANQSDGCNSSVSRDEFESHGGKLVMSRPPDMRFPRNISTICRGAAGLGITILPNGTVRTEDFEHNYFSSPGDTFETSGRTIGVCDRLMDERVKNMRFSPPRLHGEPVCVHFYVDWSSSKPNELLPFGTFK